MARIRTIKPEFPHSESMGKVSREARLCFVLMWTLADDSGRLRGNSRMLASLLFPYDDDAKDLMGGWLTELDAQECIQRYTSGGSEYIQIRNWLIHQKIDKPSKSKLPSPDEPSRTLANPREPSSEDRRIEGSKEGTKDQGREGKGESSRVPRETFDGWGFIDQRFRPAYPRGSFRHTHWIEASRVVERMVTDQGIDPDELVNSAAAYQRQKAADGSEGSKFVMAPTTFLANENWRGPFPLPKQQSPAESTEARRAREQEARNWDGWKQRARRVQFREPKAEESLPDYIRAVESAETELRNRAPTTTGPAPIAALLPTRATA